MTTHTPSGQPPQPPPKDLNLSSSGYTSSRPKSRYLNVNQDLADAVRDSVQINASDNNHHGAARRVGQVDDTGRGIDLSSPLLESRINTNSSHLPPRLPSLNPLVPRRTPSPHISVDTTTRSAVMTTQPRPQPPSARLVSSQNPFEQDEMEPMGTGLVRPPRLLVPASASGGRGKITRAQTTLSGNITSTSSSANLLQEASPTRTRARRSMSSDSYGLDAAGRELTAGQKRAAEDKKGSRHADLIDTWDPTGMGSAMWHHSGPYDAAAPSRNTNQPQTKAPMQAFNGAPVTSPPRTGPSTISLASPPAPPPKEDGDRQSKRVSMAAKHAQSRKVSGGGLTGQYSTSMPASGGYFPDVNEEPTDEAAMARKERMLAREQKRRALKAAWGTDTPEPFEDFGTTPGEGDLVEATDDGYPEDAMGRPLRSPGLRLGMGPRSPPIREDSVSPISETGAYASAYPPASRSGSVPGGPGGVKRTKSLMQKFKTMREHQNRPVRASSSKMHKSTSPTDENHLQTVELPGTHRPGFIARTSGRTSPQKQVNSSVSHEDVDVAEVVSNSAGAGFVLVESPNSKARARKALRREQAARDASAGVEMLDDVAVNDKENAVGPAMNRVKGLPRPPVAPVIPDFDDLVLGNGQGKHGGMHEGEGVGVKRKTSMVKKFKDRMVK